MNTFNFHTKIVGTSFREGITESIKALQPNQTLILVREPNNEYDPNAVSVYRGGVMLGYIPKETALKINNDVKEGRVRCTVSEVTGGTIGKDNYGVNILLEVTRVDEENNKDVKLD